MMRKRILFISALSMLFYSMQGFASQFKLASPGMAAGSTFAVAQTYNGFGCVGANISPELKWSGAPAGTKSFGLTMYDPDAPTGSGWWHWVVFNIPAKTTHLSKNAGNITAGKMPSSAVQSRTDFGKDGYGGPCPPAGDAAHRYIITLYALKVDKLPLDKNTPAAMVGYYLNANAIGKAVLSFKYSR